MPPRFSLFALLLNGSISAWAPTYYDDFTAPILNSSLWRVADNMTHGSQEWQLYLADEVYLQDGALVIRTRSRNASYGSKAYRYTSGWVDTRGSAAGETTYGKFSARIQLPEERPGVWPAYWLVDDNNHCWPRGGEIDILEAVGGVRGGAVFGTYHWGAACGKDGWATDHQNGAVPPPAGSRFSAGFHDFSAYWNRTHITWEVDGAPYVSRVVGQPAGLFVPSWPLFTIFNTAMCVCARAACPPRNHPFPDKLPLPRAAPIGACRSRRRPSRSPFTCAWTAWARGGGMGRVAQRATLKSPTMARGSTPARSLKYASIYLTKQFAPTAVQAASARPPGC